MRWRREGKGRKGRGTEGKGRKGEGKEREGGEKAGMLWPPQLDDGERWPARVGATLRIKPGEVHCCIAARRPPLVLSQTGAGAMRTPRLFSYAL